MMRLFLIVPYLLARRVDKIGCSVFIKLSDHIDFKLKVIEPNNSQN